MKRDRQSANDDIPLYRTDEEGYASYERWNGRSLPRTFYERSRKEEISGKARRDFNKEASILNMFSSGYEPPRRAPDITKGPERDRD